MSSFVSIIICHLDGGICGIILDTSKRCRVTHKKEPLPTLGPFSIRLRSNYGDMNFGSLASCQRQSRRDLRFPFGRKTPSEGWLRGGRVFKAYRLLNHPTLGLSVMEKKKNRIVWRISLWQDDTLRGLAPGDQLGDVRHSKYSSVLLLPSTVRSVPKWLASATEPHINTYVYKYTYAYS